MSEREILVGLNEGPSSRAALRWAARFALRTGGTVRAVHALSWPFSPDDSGSDGSHAALDARYRAEIDQIFRETAPRPDWILQFAEGDAGPVLVRQSRKSAALVIGAPEHVGLGRLVTGSVAHYCLSHAYCPVISVPPASPADGAAATATARPDLNDDDAQVQSVAVGIDSSASAKGALAWAAAYAHATEARLRAVHALTGGAGEQRESEIKAVFASCDPAEGWDLEFIEGPPERVLVDAATAADLLVIGTREQRGVRRLLYGSVSHHCLSRSTCPVVAVSSSARPALPQRRSGTVGTAVTP